MVRDHMTPNPVTIEYNVSIQDALKLMRQNEIRRLPVIENGDVAGLVTMEDIRAAYPKANPEDPDAALVYPMVGEVASRNLTWVSANDSILDAAVAMKNAKTSALLVSDGGNLEGILTDTDLLGVLIQLLRTQFETWIFQT
ncbi:MAG: hypothetical protein GMKNLPBB_01455 [Myxococcota bacterium]|nr:hypothetical protein [Myxococcota bacterium]